MFQPRPLSTLTAQAALIATAMAASLIAPDNVHANFTGFESRGAPTPRPNGVAPEGAADPTIQAGRAASGEIRVDGRLDEEVWQDTEAGYGFLMWDPDRGTLPSEQTVFKVAYDEGAVYFAVACLEKDPANIASSLSRRDRLRDSDQVSIYIDPYLDKDTGYNFRVTPAGVQEDAYLFDDGNRDRDWDAVWEAETFRDADGWYAEVRIPFSSIRYRPAESMTWGLQVYRYMHRRGEDTSWIVWDNTANGFVSRFGTLTGLEGVSAPRQVEVLPYLVQRTTDPSVEGPEDVYDNFQNMGLDVKYGVTADLTLNATVQPDFGQVEADPATLNLSPFETFFDEKRPFFVEGNRFFQMPSFNLFYSRRVGTGDENSRIRWASKLTGKMAGNVSVAGLYAATDVTRPGQAHNILKRGEFTSHYLVGRIGKDFAEGNHRVHLMQTAALRSAERMSEDDTELEYRDGFTTGFDFDSFFRDRKYNLTGAFVGTIVDPAAVSGEPEIDHSSKYGTGGDLTFSKHGGAWRGAFGGRWESQRLDPNDLGFLSAPNEVSSFAWMQRRYIPGENPKLNRSNVNFNLWRSWLYAGERVSGDDGGTLWEYGDGHPQNLGGNVNGSLQFRNYWSAWYGLRHGEERTDQFITRGGPLMRRPSETGGWLGVESDSRRAVSVSVDGNYTSDAVGGLFIQAGTGATWNASNSTNFEAELSYWVRQERADYLDTVDREAATDGIGGTSYVFGDLDQKTLEVTFRSNVIFNRSQSLEMYVQPFLTVGDYTNARELVTPDSYELNDYAADGFQANDFDFRFAAVNLNLVYRYEYRPGSAFFLVWTHSRNEFEERADSATGGAFRNDLDGGDLFSNEPENTILAKLTYWLPL